MFNIGLKIKIPFFFLGTLDLEPACSFDIEMESLVNPIGQIFSPLDTFKYSNLPSAQGRRWSL